MVLERSRLFAELDPWFVRGILHFVENTTVLGLGRDMKLTPIELKIKLKLLPAYLGESVEGNYSCVSG